MPDSEDFDPDNTRWAITTGLVRTGNLANPLSAVKDSGHTVNVSPSSDEENNSRADTYVQLRWLEEDALPGIAAWGGVLGGEAVGSAAVTESGTDYNVSVAAGRFWFEGLTYTIAANTALSYGISALGGGTRRYDWVVVDVDTVARTAAYAIVNGTVDRVLPALAADQFPIAVLYIEHDVAGVDPEFIHDVRMRPGPPHPRTETLIYSIADFLTVPPTAADYEFDYDEGSVKMDDNGEIFIPLHLPIGTTVTAIRIRGLKNTPSLTTDDITAVLQRRYVQSATAVPADDPMAVVGTDATLSANPFLFTQSSILEAVIFPGYSYEVRIGATNTATSLTNRPRFWAIEIDITRS